ncbi:MAG TPA: hypothetical protein VGJ54_12280 [Streptosporangiaceae bacterium]|jgi:hypothetical protein
MSTLKKVTATGNVLTGSCYLRSVIFQPGTAASTLDLRLDGAAGTVVLSMAGAANGPPVPWSATGSPGVGAAQLHATLAGAGASASFEYD